MSYLIRNMPEDVKEIIIREQNKRKEELKVFQYSIERTLWYIVKEYDKCSQIEENYKPEKSTA